jgi:hypothetical protein
LGRFNEQAMQAAAGGGGVTYVASAPTEPGVAGNGGRTQVLSWRGPDGWRSHDLSLAHERATAVAELPEWPAFSSNLSLAAVQPLGAFDESLSPLANEQTAYLYDDFQGGGGFSLGVSEACVSSCFTPLVTALNAPGVEFGVSEGGNGNNKSDHCPPDPFCGPQFEAASPNLEHVVVHSKAALTPEGSGGGLFEISDGAITFLGTGAVGAGNDEETNMLSAGSHDVSADGSRVIINTGEKNGGALLLRDSVSGQTLALAGPGSIFLGASADDSRVFFTNENGGPLEECEVVEGESGELECRSGKPLDLSFKASVYAPLPGISEDGSSVYFVSTGVLTGSEKDPGGETAISGQPNLYLSRNGATSLVAVLSSSDNTDWGKDRYLAEPPFPELALKHLTARVSPDGQWVAFESQRPLTGYDNTDASSGKPDTEVYLYHAPTSGEPASLVCASCDPTGARPTGSASVPGWTTEQYQSRYLTDGGRLFFDTSEQLVPQDTNNAEYFYEYEPPAPGAGAGGGSESEAAPANDSCSTGSPTYSALSEGCVDLISTGSSPEPSTFLDATENGDEVFFLTTAQISKRDTDSSYDVYDARVGGSEPEPAKPVECAGDACQPTIAPPENLTPGSLTFIGPGNALYTSPPTTKPAVKKKAAKCAKGKVRDKRGKCTKKSKSKKAKKSNRRGTSS